MITFKGKSWKYALAVIAVLCLGLAFLWTKLPDGKMYIRFLNIGQGDSTLIQTPEGHNILIDGGPDNSVLQELKDTIPFFNSDIDFMVLTHPHSDHLNGLIEVLKRYHVHAVLVTGVEYKNSTYEEFLRNLNEMKASGEIDLYIAQASLDFRIGSLYFDTIYPFESLAGRTIKNLNNSSIGFVIYYKDSGGVLRRFLMNGDGEVVVEEEILATDFLPNGVDIFKASHHGSRTANTYDFLSVIKPKVVVIDCGKDNKFRHPHAESIRNFYRAGVEEIYRTDLDGRVEFEF